MAHETNAPADAGPTPEDEQSWTLLAQAEHDVIRAFERYVAVLGAEPVPEPAEIVYTPSTSLMDSHQYKLDTVNTITPYREDESLARLVRSELPSLRALMLAQSPHWQDRVRAEGLRRVKRNEITLPDGFPCIYEPSDSPYRGKDLNPQPFVWVVSPDEDMLRALLPLYRELWASYEAQWISKDRPGRTFEMGRLDHLPVTQVYRPGTTPEQVIGHTFMVHSDMYATAPEHLRAMHPQHAGWVRAKKQRAAEHAALVARQGAERAASPEA